MIEVQAVDIFRDTPKEKTPTSTNKVRGILAMLINVLLWAQRATGFGHRNIRPLSHTHIDPGLSEELLRSNDRLGRDFELLEQELRRNGLRIPHRSHRRR
jgi:hypothetical protein